MEAVSMASYSASRSALMMSLNRADLSVELANTAPVDMPAAAGGVTQVSDQLACFLERLVGPGVVVRFDEVEAHGHVAPLLKTNDPPWRSGASCTPSAFNESRSVLVTTCALTRLSRTAQR